MKIAYRPKDLGGKKDQSRRKSTQRWIVSVGVCVVHVDSKYVVPVSHAGHHGSPKRLLGWPW